MKVKYLVNHGTCKKNQEVEMQESTAKALITHKIVKEVVKKQPKKAIKK